MFNDALDIFDNFPILVGTPNIELVADLSTDNIYEYGMSLANPGLFLIITWLISFVLFLSLKCCGVVYVDSKFPVVVFFLFSSVVLVSFMFAFMGVKLAFDGYYHLNDAVTSANNILSDVVDDMDTINVHSTTSDVLMNIAISLCGDFVDPITNETDIVKSVINEMIYLVDNVTFVIETVQEDAIKEVGKYRHFTFIALALVFFCACVAIFSRMALIIFPKKVNVAVLYSNVGSWCMCITPVILLLFSFVVAGVGAVALLGNHLCSYGVLDYGTEVYSSMLNITNGEVCENDVEGEVLCYYFKCEGENPVAPLFDEILQTASTTIDSLNDVGDAVDSDVCSAQLEAVVTKLTQIKGVVNEISSSVDCIIVNEIITSASDALCDNFFSGLAIIYLSSFSVVAFFLLMVVMLTTLQEQKRIYDKLG